MNYRKLIIVTTALSLFFLVIAHSATGPAQADAILENERDTSAHPAPEVDGGLEADAGLEAAHREDGTEKLIVDTTSEKKPSMNELTLGVSVLFYTDFYSYISIKLGGIIDYSRVVFLYALKKRRKIEFLVGGRTGALFEGGQKMPDDFYLTSLPVMIPLTLRPEFDVYPVHWFGIYIDVNFGLNLLVHKGDNPNFVFTFTPHLGFRFCLPREFGVKLAGGYGTMGIQKDYWWGPGFYLTLVKRL